MVFRYCEIHKKSSPTFMLASVARHVTLHMGHQYLVKSEPAPVLFEQKTVKTVITKVSC